MARLAVLGLCAWAALISPAHADPASSKADSASPKDVRIVAAALPAVPGNPYLDGPNLIRPALFDGLTRFDKDGTLAPALAAAWKNETPTSWRFVLRHDVAFSNGEPLSAAAVAATIAWLQTPDGKMTVVGSRLPDMTAEVDDEFVVMIHTKTPDPILPRRLADMMIVAPRAWADVGAEGYARTPATSGPFKLASWDANGKSVLAANPASWRKPKAERLIFTATPDHAARTKALIAGQADIAAQVDIDDMGAIDKAHLLTSVTPAMAVLAIAFRQSGDRETPLHDERVRRALNYAIDRTALSRMVLKGLGPAAGQPAAREVQGYEADVKAYPYDPEKAKALLADAGHADGFALHIAVADGRYAGDRALYQGMVESLAKVGVTLTIVPFTPDVWAHDVAANEWTPDVDGFALPFDAAPTNDVVAALEPYSCFKLVPFVCDQAVTARIAVARDTMSMERRSTLLGDLAQTFHDQAPALYLVDAFDLYALGRNVEGFTIANRVPVYEAITISARP